MTGRIAIFVTAVAAVAILMLAVFGVLGPLRSVGGWLLMVIWVVGLVVAVFVDLLVRILPPVRTLGALQTSWSALRLNSASTLSAIDFVQRRWEEVGNSLPAEAAASAKHVRVGKVITVVAKDRPPMRQVVRELRASLIAFLVLSIVGFLFQVPNIVDGGTSKFPDVLLSESTIPVLEVITIIYLTFRAWAEIGAIQSLIEDA
jgi:hypothetical protein